MNIAGHINIVGKDGKKSRSEGRVCVADVHDVESVTAEGDISFKEISGTTISLSGKISGKLLSSENVSLQGRLKVTTIVGENVDIIFSQDSHVGDISGKSIKIAPEERKNPEIVSAIIGGFLGMNVSSVPDEASSIYIKSLRGGDVDLKRCACDTVVCASAKLSDGCVIKRLYCTGNFDVDDSVNIVENISDKPLK